MAKYDRFPSRPIASIAPIKTKYDLKEHEELGEEIEALDRQSDKIGECLKETAKRLGQEITGVKVGMRIYILPNLLWCSSIEDQQKAGGQYLIPYGWYFVGFCEERKYRLTPVAQKRGSDIVEIGASEGTITSAHLRSEVIFESLLEHMSAGKTVPPARPSKLSKSSPLLRFRNDVWGLLLKFLVPSNTSGVFTFIFDLGLIGLLKSCPSLERTISLHPIWITRVLGLEHKFVGSVMAYPNLTCAGVTRYICLNASRLPDVIRNDPEFRNILRPETRHRILDRQAQAVPIEPTVEVSPKMRSMQLLATFLLGEPAYRGDVDKDPITAELLALCEKIAKDDPIFILKLARYVRHTLNFRNTTNFLLATATKIDACRPFVRSALPVCTNLPTDLLELWSFWRKLSEKIALPSCLKKGMADKFVEFSEYQLGKYLNAKVPKPQQVSVVPAKPGKGKGKGKAKAEEAPQKTAEELAKEKAEAIAKRDDPLTRPLTLKTLIRECHVNGDNAKGVGKQSQAICGVLRKRYPISKEEFEAMKLDEGGTKEFDDDRAGEKFRIPVPKTWETELSEKGNTPEVWQDLVKSKSLPFMAMLRNLRNLLLAGVSDDTHKEIIGRLRSQQQVANSKQMPIRFLSAFEAIDFDDETLAKLAEEAKSNKDFIEEEKAVGEGKDAKKVVKKRRVCRNPPNRKLLDKYRDALETAVSLAARNNVPPLECPTGGKAVVLVDVSGSMDAPMTTGPKKVHEKALVPHRRSNINGGRPIVEGQDMDLEDYFSHAGQRLSRKISISQTWIGRDLDLSCAVLDKNGANVQNVSYQQLEYSAIWHSGDITNAPNGAEEIITVDLDKLDEKAFMLVFTVNSYSGETFDSMQEAAVSLRDDGLEGNSVEGTQEICAFRLTGSHRAVVACALIRKDHGWAFRCLNTPQEKGQTVQSLLGTIKKDFEATMADAATNGKRLIDAAMLLALCLRERMGDDKCEIVLFSSPGKDGGAGYLPLRNLSPKVLANIRRCHAAAKQLGRGTQLPISYLQELAATRTGIDHLVVLTDGLVAPAKNPGEALSRWLRSYRTQVQPCKFACIDMLGLGKPCVGEGGGANDVLIAGYSEAVLRYLTQDPGSELAEVEAMEIPPPKKPKVKEEK